MIVEALAFYVFSTIAVAAAVMVIAARNTVHAVLFLILAFFNAAGLFVLLGAEFLAMILVIVYVGAVAVLFMFVVMMLDVDYAELRQGFLQYMPIGALVGIVLLAELVVVFGGWAFTPSASAVAAAPLPAPDTLSNTRALGQLLYTDYFYLFQAAGMILLVAMIGAITLTLRQRVGVRRQSAREQISRRREDVVEVRQIPSGSGA